MFSHLLGASPFQFGPFDVFLGAFCFLVIASLVVFVLVAVWLYRDAETRGMNGGLWVVMLILASLFFAFVGGLVVLIIYLLVRVEHPMLYGVPPYPGYAQPMYPPPAYPPTPPPASPATPPPPAPPAQPAVAAAAATTCRSCGAPLKPGAAFCGRCGTRV